jgi:hypothetical protein
LSRPPIPPDSEPTLDGRRSPGGDDRLTQAQTVVRGDPVGGPDPSAGSTDAPPGASTGADAAELSPALTGVAWFAWLVIVVEALALFALGMRPNVELSAEPCAGEGCGFGALTRAQLDRLDALGIPLVGIEWFLQAVSAAVILVCLGAGWLMVRRRPRAKITWVAALFPFLVMVAGSFNPLSLAGAQPAYRPWVTANGLITQVVIGALYFTFPSGRFAPRWTLWLFGAWALLLLPVNLWLLVVGTGEMPFGIAQLPNVALVIAALAIQTVRYRRYATPLQRQQCKWVYWAVAFNALAFLIGAATIALLPPSASEGVRNYLIQIAVYLVWVLTVLLMPLAFVFSVLHRRLWDVDLVLHRSLTYGLLTAALGAVLGVAVAVVQGVARVVGDGAAPTGVLLGASMLAAGAAFQPTRAALRRWVDRRFGIAVRARAAHDRWTGPRPPDVAAVPELASFTDWRRVGAGGMAAVYRASNERGEPVAVKMLHQIEQMGPREERRFERECEIVEQLDHPNIVRQLGAARSPSGRRFLILQYVEGETLARRLAGRKRLPLDEALPLLRQLAAALDHAHAHGVVHRDVKPGNVLLETGAGGGTRVVLTDFGIAKVAGGTVLTGGSVLGTVAYMSPEQIRGAHAVDHRADVYALGVVAYEMLTGSHPFPGRTSTAMMLAQLHRPPSDPRTIAPELPAAVARALLHALRKDPERRPQSAGAFVAQLAAGLAEPGFEPERTLEL